MIALVTKFGTRDLDADAPALATAHLAMAQDELAAQIIWTDITADVAKGRWVEPGSGKDHRVAVVDLAVTGAREALELASWVNGMIA
ncbi:hypothetical protein SEA_LITTLEMUNCHKIN_80 [Gordonia phage LittleMunchkin]|nr:hypothetical protein SEA_LITTLEMUNCHKIN_80 [Gordonia phage LittleMunchkin]